MRRQTYAAAVKAATLSYKSPQAVEKMRQQLRDEGCTEEYIEGMLANIRTLPDEDELIFH